MTIYSAKIRDSVLDTEYDIVFSWPNPLDSECEWLEVFYMHLANVMAKGRPEIEENAGGVLGTGLHVEYCHVVEYTIHEPINKSISQIKMNLLTQKKE
jgi:hypothetical protein